MKPTAFLLAAAACTGGAEIPVSTPIDPPAPTSTASSAVWLETLDWNWANFNHRVSLLDFRLEPLQASIIGGTSTTGQTRELGKGCDPDSCREFPFRDESELTVGWGTVTTTEATFAVGEAEALVPVGGASVELRVPAPAGDGEVSAVLRGYRADTDHPLDGPVACYDPAFGWHPTAIAIALTDPRREGSELVVDVAFAFGAGNTEDPDRVCIDEVNEQALVAMAAEVLFVVGPAAERQDIVQEAYFPFSGMASNPGEQVVPPPLDLDLPSGLRGWSKVDFAFNPGNEAGRGAYLRTLTFAIEGDTATGTSTNYSPVTQLHDFAFRFEGEVTAVPLSGVTHERLSVVLPAELDEQGEPVLFDLTTLPSGG